MPQCKKTNNGGLDQYDAGRFGRLIFATIRISVGLKGLMHFLKMSSVTLSFALVRVEEIFVYNVSLETLHWFRSYHICRIFQSPVADLDV